MSKSPAFSMYVNDFDGDEHVKLMSNQELGCYTKLLNSSWREGSIPKDIGKIARLCGEPPEGMAELWKNIKPCWQKHPTLKGRLVQKRQEEEREKQKQNSAKRAEAGKKGAKSRWDKAESIETDATVKQSNNKDMTKAKQNDGNCHNDANANALANDGLSSSFSISSSISDLKIFERERKSKDVLEFIQFSKEIHKTRLSRTLVIRPREDALRIAAMLSEVPLRLLKPAYEDFLISRDSYLQGRPRTIAVFMGQVSNYVNGVETRLANQAKQKKRDLALKRARAQPGDPKAQKLWEQCLEAARGDIREENVKNWLESLVCRKINGKKLVLVCGDEDQKLIVEENFADFLEFKLGEFFGKPMAPEFIVEGEEG